MEFILDSGLDFTLQYLANCKTLGYLEGDYRKKSTHLAFIRIMLTLFFSTFTHICLFIVSISILIKFHFDFFYSLCFNSMFQYSLLMGLKSYFFFSYSYRFHTSSLYLSLLQTWNPWDYNIKTCFYIDIELESIKRYDGMIFSSDSFNFIHSSLSFYKYLSFIIWLHKKDTVLIFATKVFFPICCFNIRLNKKQMMNIPLCHNNTIVLCFERVQYMTNIQYNNLGIEKRYYKMFALVPFKTGPGMNSFSLILLY